MPIKPDAFSSPEPEPAPPSDAAAAALVGVTNENEDPSSTPEPPKRTRRTKAQMIVEAVVPADGELVDVKDVATGAKVQRTWRDAVTLVKSGAVEFADKAMKYSLQKEEQIAAQSAFEQPAAGADTQPVATENIEQPQPAPSANVPPGAKLGDEVCVGSETMRVGHGGVLTNSPVADANGEVIRPARRWQRELGAGPDGAWQQTPLTVIGDPRPIFDKPETQPEQTYHHNGNADVAPDAPAPVVQTERLPREMEDLGDGVIKIGTGILEKIGMPQVEQFASASQFQVGPITLSRLVYDDGRRTTFTFDDGREGEIITAAAEGFELLDNTCEYIAKRFRGQLYSFLAATGAVKQPVA